MDGLTLEIKKVLEADEAVNAVLARHHALMRSQSPAESCHVMTADELRENGAHVYAGYSNDLPMAVGAFKALAGKAVELKSMHVVEELRGKGAGRAMLSFLLNETRVFGAQSVYLETGANEVFAPARALYEEFGFSYCSPFGSYKEDPYSVFMHLRV